MSATEPLDDEDLPDTHEQQRVDQAIKQIERLTAEVERLRLNAAFARIVRGGTDD